MTKLPESGNAPFEATLRRPLVRQTGPTAGKVKVYMLSYMWSQSLQRTEKSSSCTFRLSKEESRRRLPSMALVQGSRLENLEEESKRSIRAHFERKLT